MVEGRKPGGGLKAAPGLHKAAANHARRRRCRRRWRGKVRLALVEVELERGTGGECVDRRIKSLGSPAGDALEPDDGAAPRIADDPSLRGQLCEVALVQLIAEPDRAAACELRDDGRLDGV